MSRLLVVGDIHGYKRALDDALTKAKFSPFKDRLLLLGDLVDRGPRSREVLEYLISLKKEMGDNFILLRGNHDRWFSNHIAAGWPNSDWLRQGGSETLQSYPGTIPPEHQQFLLSAKNYHQENNMVFVHAGFDLKESIYLQTERDLILGRSLVHIARAGHTITAFKSDKPYIAVFVGHTPTLQYNSQEPLNFQNLYMLDCGVAYGGRLAVMDAETKEYWVSFKTGASEQWVEKEYHVRTPEYLIR